MAERRAAVFLDRDGVINENNPSYVRGWDAFHFIPGSIDAVRRLSDAGLLIVVVTNQAGIGRGVLPAEALDDIHTRMCEQIAAAGGEIARVSFCPHRPEEGCGCRKPLPGMLNEAAEDLMIDPAQSFMVGDHFTDIEAGRAAGCTSILVRTGRGADELRVAGDDHRDELVVADDLAQATDFILREAARISAN